MILKLVLPYQLGVHEVRTSKERVPETGDLVELELTREQLRALREELGYVYGRWRTLRAWGVSEAFAVPNEREQVVVAHLQTEHPPSLSGRELIQRDPPRYKAVVNPAYRKWLAQYVASGASDAHGHETFVAHARRLLRPHEYDLAMSAFDAVQTVSVTTYGANPNPLSSVYYEQWYRRMLHPSP